MARQQPTNPQAYPAAYPLYPAPYPPYPPYAARPIQSAPRRKPSFLRDIYNGAVVGDFAREMGLAGALTQMLIGYCPGLGTVCASRDLVADLRQRERLGAALNFLAIFPVLGGFPKTAAVLRHLHLIGRAVAKSNRREGWR